MKLPYKVYPEKRKRGWVVIHMTGISGSSVAREIWKPALIAPRKPRYFSTRDEAVEYATRIK
ncbi:hypothetical protein LCGC14_1635320 [marine sediment metagenome]|uniref:Uncharacterized protein n=1 Tax=marine sediment metagenome TaxID=412755 RepID=A0A0F9INM2_9ZZZZ